ncbi:Gfo/Idh/MocA family oxidoreductase [Rubellicoccus peritrichatus]|uniref:Gfo/Idh/MocA family oxidoreductase n=1 Tax=Rubellicoccus peritrichatus TaxID=3080537 RepID=A0AAQ3LA94_9BACT|nr:Gfo/Idh/MocA family oxidoreductase [Puniceicoccus sp. CR14]WOO39778.1 Gfo/Idh/MocA family oxidoreductase [Puniceicoccus sp. CR14]
MNLGVTKEKRIKAALVGLGFGRQVLKPMILEGLASKYFDCVAVCDANEERTKLTAEEHGLRGYTDLDELLKDEEIRVIILITGPNGRADLITKIIESGRDVMTTKPFEQDADAALRVFKRAKELGRVIHMNSPSLTPSRDIQTIRQWQEKYNLGQLCAGRWEGWYKVVEKADGSWYDDPDTCPAAPLFRLGIYGLNDMALLFGEAEYVQVQQSRFFTGRPTPDLAQMNIKFKSGALFSMLGGWCIEPWRGVCGLTLFHEHGTIVRDVDWPSYAAGKERITLKVFTPESGFGQPVECIALDDEDSSSSYRWDLFYEAIHGKEFEAQATPESIASAIRIVNAMRVAAKSGDQVAVV